MAKKTTNSASNSAVKTEEALLKDIKDPIEAAIEPAEEKKPRFPKLKKFNEKREENSVKHSKLNRFIMIIFPLFICCMAEITQSKYISSFVSLITERPTVFLFDLIITTLVFIFLLGIFKKGWLTILIQSFIFMALSTTELFKYGTNGNHLILSDMKLVRSVKSLTSFAYIKITPRLIYFGNILCREAPAVNTAENIIKERRVDPP